MINIVLIGAGKLGSRHLQALAKIGIESNIYVVDPSVESSEIAYARYNEIPQNCNIKHLEFLKNIGDLRIQTVDVAIIATSSEHRFLVLNALLNHVKVNYLILEKFLFQKASQYKEAKELLLKYHVKTWVNCPRRMWRLYKDLKKDLVNLQIREFTLIGSDWSLATSSVHILDLIAFLTGCSEYNLLDLDLGNKFVPAYSSVTGPRDSKYVEFYGAIRGKFVNGTNFTFNCLEDIQIPFQIDIRLDDKNIHIFEEHGKLVVMKIDKNGTISNSEFPFSCPYQSDLTQLVVENLIHSGECDLTSFDESVSLHLPILFHFQSYLSSLQQNKVEFLPIT
jgi:hypothetical protein